uniref:KRAB domain-containing protein n=1 Tax=Chelydra serpentina TaxID=8475 RepID=A0A8C3SKZ3_CHESE
MYFSPAEWALLSEEQRQLYKHVMWENYQTLVSLGEELLVGWNGVYWESFSLSPTEVGPIKDITSFTWSL